MISWIRVDRAIGNDVKVYQLAEATKLDVDAVVGKLVRLFAEMAAHARDGDISEVPDQGLEAWANWRGRSGVFAESFRRLFAPDGIVTAWMKHNGTAIEKAERDAARLAERRSRGRTAAGGCTPGGRAAERRATDARQTRDGTQDRRATDARASRVDVNEDVNENYVGIDLPTKNTLSRPTDGSPAGAGGVSPGGRQVLAEGEFARAWGLYPKRAGSNPRRAAEDAWNARVRAGVRPSVLVAAVERYRAYCDAEHQTGTRYVMRGSTFFGPDEHYAETWDVGTERDEPDRGAALLAEQARLEQRGAEWIAERMAGAHGRQPVAPQSARMVS